MNRADLAAIVADRTGSSRQEANRAVEAVFATIVEALKRGEEVRIPGFGNFSVKQRAGRFGRNPRTGETIEIKPARQAKFKAGSGLQDTLNM